ncbi:MAG: hypothetical protein IAF02_29310 [Anaerolineae bacterium]|nr:hypothetical protein [Anaerolineae bacterium]
MTQYHIRPTDGNRAALWQDLLQRGSLPITDGRARAGYGGQLVYDIDVRALSDIDRARLAGLIALQNQISIFEARELVTVDGVSIPAVGTELMIEN